MERYQVRIYAWSGASLGFLRTVGDPTTHQLAATTANGYNDGTLDCLRRGNYLHNTFHLAVAEPCDKPVSESHRRSS